MHDVRSISEDGRRTSKSRGRPHPRAPKSNYSAIIFGAVLFLDMLGRSGGAELGLKKQLTAIWALFLKTGDCPNLLDLPP
eukprot:629564-Pyramimonas_sp.AAC.1